MEKKVWLFVFLAVAGGSILFTVKYFKTAFPEASLEINVKKEEAVRIAGRFLSSLNERHLRYKHAIIMDEDSKAKNFFDREFGASYLDSLIKKGVKIWFWHVRWFLPLEKREYRVLIDPNTGRIKGYNRIIEEEEPGGKLEIEKAREIALSFLKREKIDVASYELVEEGSENIKGKDGEIVRIDHYFVWERKGWSEKNAKYRIRVGIQGDRLGSYREWVKVPEKWERRYERERSYNNLAQQIAQALGFLLLGLSGIFFFLYLRRRIQLKLSFYIGAFVFVVVFLSLLNSLPLYIVHFYQTTQSFSAFWLRNIVNFLINAFITGAVVFLTGASGEVLYRQWLKDKVFLPKLFSLSGFKTKEARYSIAMGYLFAAVHIGFVTLFYLLGKKIGFWTPTDIGYTDAINTKFPWLFALFAFSPAFLEEFSFRLFGVSFFKKITRSSLIAFIIPSFIWGFLHSAYPQQPFFVRGLEVGIIGVIASVIMVKFGILATITWHYAVDALFMGLFLFRSKNPELFIAGVVSVGIFLFPLLLSFIIKKREKEEEIYNVRYPVEIKKRVKRKESIKPLYTPLPTKKRWISLISSIVFILGVIGFVNKELKININISANEAEKKAFFFLKQKGINVDEMKKVTYLWVKESDEEVNYVARKEGVKGIKKFLSTKPSVLWKTRFFVPLKKEEYKVEINPSDLKIYSYKHLLPEDKKGKKVSLEEALKIAALFLKEKGVDVEKLKLVKKEKKEKEKRIDYFFEWETEKKIAKAVKRIKLSVKGDEPSGFEVYYKIPERWKRNYQREVALDWIKRGVYLIVWLLGILGLAFSFGRMVKRGEVENKRALTLSFLGILFYTLHLLNGWRFLLKNYPTSIPLENFIGVSILGMFIGVAVIGTGFFLINSLSLGFFKKYGATKGYAVSGDYIKDGIISGLFGGAGALFILYLFKNMVFWTNAKVHRIDFLSFPLFDRFLPFLSFPWRIAFFSLMVIPLFISLYFVLQEYIPYKWLRYLLVLMVITVFSFRSEKEISGFLLKFGFNLSLVLFGWVSARYFLKENLLSYIIGGAVFITLPVILKLISAGSFFFFLNGVLGIGVLLLFIGLIFYILKRR